MHRQGVNKAEFRPFDLSGGKAGEPSLARRGAGVGASDGISSEHGGVVVRLLAWVARPTRSRHGASTRLLIRLDLVHLVATGLRRGVACASPCWVQPASATSHRRHRACYGAPASMQPEVHDVSLFTSRWSMSKFRGGRPPCVTLREQAAQDWALGDLWRRALSFSLFFDGELSCRWRHRLCSRKARSCSTTRSLSSPRLRGMPLASQACHP